MVQTSILGSWNDHWLAILFLLTMPKKKDKATQRPAHGFTGHCWETDDPLVISYSLRHRKCTI
jgi:hypothetical protein